GLRFASACLRTENTALKLIARAEQSVAGLSRKLDKRGHESACVLPVISRLTELKLIDDRRFVRLWLESRLACRTASPRRLLAGLYGRGIDHEEAESGLRAILDAETEIGLLRRYIKKIEKKKNYSKIINKNRADSGRAGFALKYHLKGEGFSSRAIEMYIDGENDDLTLNYF
ncbi:MAG: RecX family transcriptional regulator, partial [Treponema sp.]|nr:RecX family transcriptional regulator [Treponema sp.]